MADRLVMGLAEHSYSTRTVCVQYPVSSVPGTRSGIESEREPPSIYQETLIPVLLPVPLPVLVPIQNLTQSQFVSIEMIEPVDFTPLAS